MLCTTSRAAGLKSARAEAGGHRRAAQRRAGAAHLVRVQEAVVDPQLHQLGQQVQDLPLQPHGCGGRVPLQRLYDQRLEQADVAVDRALRGQRVRG